MSFREFGLWVSLAGLVLILLAGLLVEFAVWLERRETRR